MRRRGSSAAAKVTCCRGASYCLVLGPLPWLGKPSSSVALADLWGSPARPTLADLWGPCPPDPGCLAAPSPSVPTPCHPHTTLSPWCRMPQSAPVSEPSSRLVSPRWLHWESASLRGWTLSPGQPSVMPLGTWVLSPGSRTMIAAQGWVTLEPSECFHPGDEGGGGQHPGVRGGPEVLLPAPQRGLTPGTNTVSRATRRGKGTTVSLTTRCPGKPRRAVFITNRKRPAAPGI